MATNTYTIIDGEVVHESRAGTQHDYVPDPLGSTVALINSLQTQTDTWAYWPYGEVRAQTGTTSTPFQFVGTLGYYRDSPVKTYVRARYLDRARGRWTTRKPRGAVRTEPAYAYVHDSPATAFDLSGRDTINPPDLGKKLVECLKKCNGKTGKDWAGCMLGCLGNLGWKYCSYVACLALPQQLCPHGCDPCGKSGCEKYVSSACDCCEVKWYCCMAQARNRLAVEKCNDDQINCECQNDCAQAGNAP